MARLAVRVTFSLAILSALAGLQAAHAQSAGQPATVRVQSTRDPVDKSYRKMVKGMERFARAHALAPDASLRFRLLPRVPTVDMSGITLRIAGDSLSIPVPVAPDNSFVLPRIDAALREDAAVVANRKTTSMTWRAQILTPGLPPGTRRLGDLRLECLVGVEAGLVSNSSPLFGWVADALTTPEQVCNSPNGNYLFFAERPIFAVRLRAGSGPDARVDTLPFHMLYAGGEQTRADLQYCDCQAMLDRTFYAPIWDRSWPDDTLVEFEYMEEAP